jgi:hypothetical protein
MLVEQHADQQRERILGQQLIGLRLLRQAELRSQRRSLRRATSLHTP